MNQHSDREILDLFKEESTRRKAFTMLVTQYQKRLYWIIRRMVISHDDTDDVLQNTLIKIWKGLPTFREDSQLFSWIYRIAYNESVTFLKQKKRDLSLSSEAFQNYMGNRFCNDEDISCTEIEEKLHRALQHVPDKQRVVFYLRYYDEMPYERMSEMLGTSVGALKASYHLAMKKIEKMMLED
jgi:RNA polymerase sigma factor (sigma-70 family)